MPNTQSSWWSETPPAQNDQNLDVLTTVDSALDIGRPLAEVNGYVLDFSRHIEWVHTYLRVEGPAEKPTKPGDRFRVWERQDLGWDKRSFETIADRVGWDVTTDVTIQVVEDQHLAWRATVVDGDELRAGFLDWTVVLEPITPQITRVRMRSKLGGPIEALTVWMNELRAGGYPLDVLQRQADRSLHNLRSILESGG